MRIGSAGRSVTRMLGRGSSGLVASTRKLRSSTAKIATASSVAKPAPMQTRGPAPKGMKA